MESEWNKHENCLHESYLNKRASITGEKEVSSPKKAVGDESRWQSPEKQKTLIHTAPVLSPKNNSSPSGSGARAARGFTRKEGSSTTISRTESMSSMESYHNPELDKLNNSYRKALRSAAIQKAAALKWISRQSIRLLAQCTEVHRERQFIGMILSDLECHLRQLQELSGSGTSRDDHSSSPDAITTDLSPLVQVTKALNDTKLSAEVDT